MKTKVCQYLVAVALFLALPSVVLCSTHFCMTGHMHHPPYSWVDFVSDFTYIVLLVAAVALSKIGNLPERFLVYSVIALVCIGFLLLPGVPVALLLLGTGLYVLVCAVSNRVVPPPDKA